MSICALTWSPSPPSVTVTFVGPSFCGDSGYGPSPCSFTVQSNSNGIASVALETGVPVLNGILAVHDAAQAAARAGGAVGNRGSEVALAAVQMAALRRALPEFLDAKAVHDARS
jgi:hypothetical protein